IAQRAAERRAALAGDEAGIADTVAAIERQAVIDLAGVVGGYRQRRPVHAQLAGDIADRVVAGGQPRRGERVAAGVDRALRRPAIAQRAPERRAALAGDEAGIADTVSAVERQAVIDLAGVVGGYRQRRLVHAQLAGDIADRVIAGGQPRRGERVAAGVDRALRRPAIAQRAAERRAALAGDEAGIADTVAAVERQAVIDLALVV